jgi:hypothetical protein
MCYVTTLSWNNLRAVADEGGRTGWEKALT